MKSSWPGVGLPRTRPPLRKTRHYPYSTDPELLATVQAGSIVFEMLRSAYVVGVADELGRLSRSVRHYKQKHISGSRVETVP